MTAGSYDIVVEGYFRSAEHLLGFVTDGLAYEGINQGNTFMVLRLYKFSYAWGLGIAPGELERLYSEVGLPLVEDNSWWTQLTRRVGSRLKDRGAESTGSDRPDEVLGPQERIMVNLLQENGRRPFADIAKHAEVSEETVRRKVQSMINDGVLRIAAFVRPALTGFQLPVILNITVDRAQIERIVKGLGRYRQVAYLAAVTGPADVIAACYLRDSSELMEFLMDKLGCIPGIRQVDVSVMLGVRKRLYR